MSSARSPFRRSIALPSDHGSWVFLLSPLIIGLAVGGRWTTPAFYLVVAAVCGFLSRQPLVIAVKALSGRRPREDLYPALLWSTIYGAIASIHVLGLVVRGFGYILFLAIPGMAVFLWYLYLVSRREERGQIGLEILGGGVFALTAPAGLWAGSGYPDRLGWLLWALTWAQSAASIVYVYLRLQQRLLTSSPTASQCLRMGLPSLAVTSLNLLLVAALGIDGLISLPLTIAFLPQWFEALQGSWHPAMGYRPGSIGVRQMIVSTLFTLLFIWSW
jgi:hypothetical protein